MALKDILAISGKGGLYKFISQSRNGIIVESLSDNKRTHIPATAKISALEDIAIFTETAEVPLNEVFKKISEKEEGGKTINPKEASNEAMKEYMEEVLPDYDHDRVYVSDLKKVFTWYNVLHEFDLLSFEEEEKETEEKPEETDDAKASEKDADEEANSDEEKTE